MPARQEAARALAWRDIHGNAPVESVMWPTLSQSRRYRRSYIRPGQPRSGDGTVSAQSWRTERFAHAYAPKPDTTFATT